MDYDVLYAAWRKIGADLHGLVWADFVDAIEEETEISKIEKQIIDEVIEEIKTEKRN